jgi:Tfp pilus assembly protein PilN
VIGLEVNITGKERRWKGVMLRLQGDRIFIDRYYAPETDTPRSIPLKKCPVVLALTGENVITKKVREADEFTMLSRVIPISRQEEFFYRIDPAEEGYRRVLLVRKRDIEQLLDVLRPTRCFIEEILSGEIVDERVVELLEPDETVVPGFLPAYAAALSFFMREEEVSFYHFFPRYKGNSHAYYRKFKVLFAGTLLLLSILFAINHGISRAQNRKLERYIEQAGANRTLVEELDKIIARCKECSVFIAEKRLGEGSYHAFYCDRIARLTPDKTRLTRLEINPPGRKIKEDEEISYQERTILISGVTSTPTDVDRFMKALLNEPWVEKIARHDYTTGENGNLFHIEIQYNLMIP